MGETASHFERLSAGFILGCFHRVHSSLHVFQRSDAERTSPEDHISVDTGRHWLQPGSVLHGQVPRHVWPAVPDRPS